MAPDAPQRSNPDIVVVPDEDQQIWVEPPYKVIIHNDNITTFEFVEKLLMTIFGKTEFEAAAIAWITHSQGNAVVVVKPQSEAEALVRKGIFAARLEGYPLKLTAEPDT
jgi:ATP-dependent Clp protease adaptor protein ClpS